MSSDVMDIDHLSYVRERLSALAGKELAQVAVDNGLSTTTLYEIRSKERSNPGYIAVMSLFRYLRAAEPKRTAS